MNFENILHETYGIDREICRLGSLVEEELVSVFREIDQTRDYNQIKVLNAMQEAGLAERHLFGTTGYGYDDAGRELLDQVYAKVFDTEDALVRTQIVCGTQSLALCYFGILRPGDELLSVTGRLYDTLDEVIGLRENPLSLAAMGVAYRQVDLLPDGSPDYEEISASVTGSTKMAVIQRSRGYSYRESFDIETIGKIISAVKAANPNTIVLVDNCYGEFVDTAEPSNVGADLMAGSLIKNPGGGLALTGGYVAGKAQLVALCADRLTAPGLGKHVGASLDHNRQMIQGFYMAPHTVAESLKGAVFTAGLFERLGFETSPAATAKRSDIIQAVRFEDPEKLKAFCRNVQAAAPVDSYVSPEPWDMPGYEDPVIMAAGAFVQGSSIELSADGPMKPPYIAFMQGGLVYANVKLAALLGADRMLKEER